MKKWISPKRNWKGIQFESLRRQVDPPFNVLHDALSKAFYEEKPFVWKGKDWGILDKNTFDKLHGLVFLHRAVEFHQANKAQVGKDKIPESEYNFIYDEKGKVIGQDSDRAQTTISELKNEGIELEV